MQTSGGQMRRSIMAVALVVSGCSQPSILAKKQDDRICLNPPATQAQGDWAACIHRWSYRLAGAPDTAKDIAPAVVAACSDAIAWQINHVKDNREQLAADLMRSANENALFRVVQARAGHCSIP